MRLIRVLIALLTCPTFAWATVDNYTTVVQPPPSTTENFTAVVQSSGGPCPYAVVGNDPCASAPAPTTAYWIQPNFFAPGGYANVNAATTANYSATRPQYNVPGVDYAIGPYTPIANLKDPAVAGNLPAGCAYSTTTSGTGAGEVTCSGAAFLGTLAHMNFGPIGGHSCTAIKFTLGGATPPPVTLDDDYGFNDTDLCSIATTEGVWLTIGGVPPAITISNSVFDGNWLAMRAPPATCRDCIPFVLVGLGGQKSVTTIKYSVITHFPGRPLAMGFSPGFGFELIGSWVEGYCSSTLHGHCEWNIGPGSTGVIDHGWQASYNVLMQDWQASNFGPMPIFTAANFPVFYSNVTGGPAFSIDHDVIINPFIGGAISNQGAKFASCIGATISAAGVCSGAGPYFFETARFPNAAGITAPAFPGTLSSCGGSNVSLVAGTQVLPPPPGALSQWLYDNSTTYAPVNAGPAVCPTATITPQVGSYSVTGWGSVFTGQVVVASNFMDVSSQPGYPSNPAVYQLAGASHSMGNGVTASISGNILTTSASVQLNAQESVAAAGICTSADYSQCPMIAVSASGTTHQLTQSYGTVAAETMTVLDLATCSTPIAFSNNIDMVTGLASAVLNQPSNGPSPLVIGCQ